MRFSLKWRSKSQDLTTKSECGTPTAEEQRFVSVRDFLSAMGLGSGSTINCDTVAGQTIAYARCSALFSVVTKKSAAIRNARWWAVDPSDDARQVAGRTEELNRWKHPNDFQTIEDFTAMIEAFKDIYGKAYILRWEPVGVPTAYELYVIPNPLVQEVTTSEFTGFRPDPQIDYYMVSINDYQIRVDRDQMFVVRDSAYNPNIFGASQSRLSALQNAVNPFVSSFEAQNELIINRGALGIISLNSEDFRTSVLPENKEDREQAQAALRRYGVMKGQYKYIVTGLKAAFVQISANMKDMNLTEVQHNAKKEIADAYQVPYVLIDTEGTTYANLTAAEVKLYNDAIKPDAEQISEVLNAAHGFDGFRIVPYFDHLSIFQEAKRLYADSLTAAVTAASNAIASGLITEQQGKNIISNILE